MPVLRFSQRRRPIVISGDITQTLSSCYRPMKAIEIHPADTKDGAYIVGITIAAQHFVRLTADPGETHDR